MPVRQKRRPSGSRRARATGSKARGREAPLDERAPKSHGRVSAKTLKVRAAQQASRSSPAWFLGIREVDSARLTQLVADGLSFEAAAQLADNLDIPASELTSDYVHIPKQTLSRRRATGKFTTDESDRLVRYARILKHATDMMEGDQAAANRWLKTPQTLLEQCTPMEYARTESGAAEVQQLIGRIEAGVYS
ncbi:MAG: antitoxin Xre/MbcA/ParS toxin-binding domain-containing protein [Pseudomonadota bacterium]